MSSYLTNNFCYQAIKALATDTCKVILMASGFSFDRATNKVYSDVSASELPTANGYTAGGATLSGGTASQDDTNNRGKVIWTNPAWTVSTANLVTCGAFPLDTASTYGAANTLVGYIDFGGNQTTLPGGTFTIANIQVEVDG